VRGSNDSLRDRDGRGVAASSSGNATPSVSMTCSEKTKRVLVIAYDFPPRRTSGVYRTTNQTKPLV
jgi:hypothetical protein